MSRARSVRSDATGKQKGALFIFTTLTHFPKFSPSIFLQARSIRNLSLHETSKPPSHGGRTSKRALPREFLELKERYQSAIISGGGSVLLDIQSPVSEASKAFMDKLHSRRRRAAAVQPPSQGGEDNNNDSAVTREDFVRARAVLKAVGWIQHVLSKVDWGRLRHDELSTGELCDTAYTLGNVVRLWKECAPEIESLMGSNHMKVLRRRDEFLKLLSQSKKLKYPNRSLYAALDRQAKRQMEATGRSNFLTWLPDECWHYDTPPPPPEQSLKCSREQYVKIASMWQQIQMNLFMAQLESTLYHDLIPELFKQRGNNPSGMGEDELAYKLRVVRSIILSGKTNRCATIGKYQDAI